MENRIHHTEASVWDKDNFAHTFNFKHSEEGFEKKVEGADYLFKEISSADELKKVLEVQKQAWAWDDRELAPVHILALMPDTGGGVFGAYNDKHEIVGFAAGFGGGVDKITGKPMLISSMLAIADQDMRGKGIGRELKIVQAYYGLQNGYEMMKWLYDPERGGNASLNIKKLGAMAEEFYIDKYGEMRSGLYGSIVPTDRLRAVWRYTEPKTVQKLTKEKSVDINVDDLPIATPAYLPESDKVLVEISGNIDSIPEEEKIERRYKLRTILSHYFFKQNYIASDFVSHIQDENRRNYYLLEPFSKVVAEGRVTA